MFPDREGRTDTGVALCGSLRAEPPAQHVVMTRVEAVACRLLAGVPMRLAAGSGIAIGLSLNGCVLPIHADAASNRSIDLLR